MFDIKSVLSFYLRGLVMFLWPEICQKNLTVAYIDYPMVKLVSLYYISPKVSFQEPIHDIKWRLTSDDLVFLEHIKYAMGNFISSVPIPSFTLFNVPQSSWEILLFAEWTTATTLLGLANATYVPRGIYTAQHIAKCGDVSSFTTTDFPN